MIGTWHTHMGQAYPSGADYQTFRNFPGLSHYIVGDDGVKCYKVNRGTVYEDPITP